ncbi:hypothetical protein CWO90_46360 [Bradyrhizobium sp. Leo121]|nr:hypothetical protein [Bradyrhizobium sp. Leo121]RZN11600.1 hypothetical protein CWO90_46360 [Bradyrhizobium sp. Leo121]
MEVRRRSKQSTTLENRLAEEAVRLRKEAQGGPPGERERLIRRARQAETAAHLSEWLKPRRLQPLR